LSFHVATLANDTLTQDEAAHFLPGGAQKIMTATDDLLHPPLRLLLRT
jgi:hypothetical protein